MYDHWEADAIVAEVNQGGDMVSAIIKSIRPEIKVISVHASRGKTTRAEPISALYAQGKISHFGSLPLLEDQMVLFTPWGIDGQTTADRVDALVWCLSELFQRRATAREPIQVRSQVPRSGRSEMTGY
jgi:phage terminase large subunit-like protein